MIRRRTLQQRTLQKHEETLFRYRLSQMNSQKREALQARGVSSGERGHGEAGALPIAALGRDPAGPPRPEEPGRGGISSAPPVPNVPGTFGGSGGYAEAEGPSPFASRYPAEDGREGGNFATAVGQQRDGHKRRAENGKTISRYMHAMPVDARLFKCS